MIRQCTRTHQTFFHLNNTHAQATLFLSFERHKKKGFELLIPIPLLIFPMKRVEIASSNISNALDFCADFGKTIGVCGILVFPFELVRLEIAVESDQGLGCDVMNLKVPLPSFLPFFLLCFLTTWSMNPFINPRNANIYLNPTVTISPSHENSISHQNPSASFPSLPTSSALDYTTFFSFCLFWVRRCGVDDDGPFSVSNGVWDFSEVLEVREVRVRV